MTRLPLTIDPCPIVEALVEIRFKTTFPQDTIIGVFYSAVKERYPDLEKQPVTDIPEKLREANPNLTFTPYYRLKGEHIFCQIGPNVLTVNCLEPYVGWELYYSEIEFVFNKFAETQISSNFLRLGIRYINFFDTNIFDNINLELSINNSRSSGENTSIRTACPSNNFENTLHVLSDRQIKLNDTVISGSIIDIDTYKILDDAHTVANVLDLVNEGHIEEKKLFFNLLKSDFLKTFNPKYGEL